MTTTGPLLEVRGLTVRYPGFRLGPLDLSLRSGERVGLVGANGAGKSTTLGALGGRLPRWEGEVCWRGRELGSLLPGVRARIGYLPERLLGYGWMTVDEHLRFLSAFYPTWDRDYEGALVERLGLDRSAKVGTLSRGTKVKLSFVSAEAYRPPALLLDEPTSGIDPVMRTDLLALLDECVPAGGDRILLFSSHLLDDVTRICDRMLLLRDGRLVGDRSREELRSRSPGESLVDILYSELADDG